VSTRLAPPPAPASEATGTPPGAGRRAGDPPPGWRPSAAEAALGLVTVAASVGMVRLFVGGGFLWPVLVVVVAAHALSVVLRRLGVGAPGAAVLCAAGLFVVLGWVVEPHTLTLGLPLSRTWHAMGADLHAAGVRFGQVRAPTEATRGFVLTCAAAAGVVAVTGDMLAFRARARFEALGPSFVLFLFGAILGAERLRLPTTALYLAAVLGFVIFADASRRATPSWFAGRAGDGGRALVRSGLATAMVAVLAALVVGPRIPGAHDLGALGWRKGADRGSGSRVTVSPLVDIRSRLVDQSGTELFSVASPVATYWRLTSLERFDGTIWSSVGSYGPARGRLPSGVPSRSADQSVVQRFDLRALSTIWLPAAYQPRSLTGVDDVRFDADSSSLLTDAATSDNLRYTVESALPRLDAAQLGTASTTLPADQASRYLELPSGFPDRVRSLAAEVTRAAPAVCTSLGCSAAEASSGRLTPFHQARALQDWFRANFDYDLDVPAGHDDSAIERFLFATRRGYCEQFAGSFAAMARSLGLPSRVAVGFTPGTSGADGRWHVTDREAHAWPEVYLAPFGWVAFEPTPSRSMPGAEAYTGLDGPRAGTGADPANAAVTTTPTTSAAAPAAGPDTTAPAAAAARASAGARGGSGFPVPFPLVVLGAAVAAYAIGVPLALRLRRTRRRARTTTPSGRVLLAWTEAEEHLASAGLGRRPAETAPEYAARASSGAHGAGPEIIALAGYVTAATFAPAGADERTAADAELAAAAVRSEVARDVTPVRRAVRGLDPRPLVRR
jgi:transglutaminase-like putative cysteine protease